MNNRAVCLLSGGLDSTTSLAWARDQGLECHALTIDYGQRHRYELEAAARVANSLSVKRHIVVPIDLRVFGGSALTADIDVPKGRTATEMASAAIPITYVPGRNTIFLSLAMAWAEVLEAEHIVIGVNVVDYSGYPDCRPEFIHAFETMANLATKTGVEGSTKVKIATPLITLSKPDIIRLGAQLGVDFSLTSTCYDPEEDGTACGACDACLLRLKGFEDAGLKDPIPYRCFPPNSKV